MSSENAPANGDPKKMLALAEELVGSDTVNRVLGAVVIADRVYNINNDDSLEIAYRAGRRVGALFEQEGERVLSRKNRISEPVYQAFKSEAYREPNPAKLRYSREGDRALVLYSEGGYGAPAFEFSYFLRELGFKRENIIAPHHLEPLDSQLAAEAFRSSGKRFLEGFTTTRGPYTFSLEAVDPFCNIVVYFTGIGGEGYFIFMDNDPGVNYEDWAEQFKDHKGNIVFVNDTAFADRVGKPLRKLGLLQTRAMLLAGSTDGESRDNVFSRELMEAYRNGNVYTPADIELPCHSTLPDMLGAIFGVEKQPSEKGQHIQKPSKSGASLDYLLLKHKNAST